MVFMQRQRMKDLLLRALVVVRTSKINILRLHLADFVVFFRNQPMKSLICGVVVVVAVVIS